jgi:predicted O-methyltransferase YrrM
MLSLLKSHIRKIFYRFILFRQLVGLLSILSGRTRAVGMSHLSSYREDDAVGPLQRDEAVALFGIIRTLRPSVVVEFGFFHGHSAFNFLQAMPAKSRLYSYDISAESIHRAHTEFTFDSRFTFLGKSQQDFNPEDVGHQKIDFVFFDAAHELEMNKETYKLIAPHLSPDAMIAVHDTGLWHRAHFSEVHHAFTREMPGEWLNENLYAHQPGERTFIDWIVMLDHGFAALHFHSTDTLRHGFSLLQRQRLLSR